MSVSPDPIIEFFRRALARDKIPEWQRPFLDLVVPGRKIVLRQSALNVFTHCSRKYFYEYIASEDELSAKPSSFPVRMLIGSLCHEVVSQGVVSRDGYHEIEEGDYNGVMSVIDYLRAKQDYNMEGHSVEFIARRFFDKSLFWGYSLYNIARIAKGMLFVSGYKFLETEYKMSYTISPALASSYTDKDISEAGSIEISGTLDALCEKDNELVVVDFKFGGLANRLLDGSSSVKADSYSPLEITYSTQFNMYDFMLRHDTANYRKPSSYAYIVPVSVIPNQSGKNKGKWRGELIHSAPALTQDQVDNYFYNDLLEVTRELSRCIKDKVWIRSHPSVYGRLVCPSCRWKNECLGVTEVSDAYTLDDPGYEME